MSVNAVAWQMPYHAEHHLYPNVPFHALARLHRKVRDHVVVEPRGYVAGQLAIIRGLKRTAAHGGRRDRGQAPLL